MGNYRHGFWEAAARRVQARMGAFDVYDLVEEYKRLTGIDDVSHRVALSWLYRFRKQHGSLEMISPPKFGPYGWPGTWRFRL